MPLEPGTMLGHYEIRSLIGVGGMGEVYRAHDHKLARDVALKVLPEAFARDPERIARFRREARLLAALKLALCWSAPAAASCAACTFGGSAR